MVDDSRKSAAGGVSIQPVRRWVRQADGSWIHMEFESHRAASRNMAERYVEALNKANSLEKTGKDAS